MFTLPIKSENENLRYEKIHEINDEEFRFVCDWNGREGFWYLTVMNINGSYIRGLLGIKIVVNWILNRFVREGTFAQGALIAINETNTDPDQTNLKLIFVTQDEIDEIEE